MRTAADQLVLLFGTPPKVIAQPFLLEVFMRDGRSYYVRSVATYHEDNDLIILIVWDFRAFTVDDIDALKSQFNRKVAQDELANHEALHPKLDWAILAANKQDILYNIEWSPRLWPPEVQEEHQQMGYRLSE